MVIMKFLKTLTEYALYTKLRLGGFHMANKLSRISLKVKFFSVVLIFIIISFLIGIVGVWNLSGMKDQITKIVNNSAKKIILATDINKNLLLVSRSEKNMLISENESVTSL